ncbi:MAG TPA: hypothetical protein VGJ72_13475 [Polaromonas sp.]
MRQLFKQANQELNLAGFLRLDAGCFIGGSAAICDPACPLTCGLAPRHHPWHDTLCAGRSSAKTPVHAVWRKPGKNDNWLCFG